jgi:hypothetical protein
MLIGNEERADMTTLNALVKRSVSRLEPRCALIKIDVEGAELTVIDGASNWLDPSNYFLIEVHDEAYIDLLRARFAKAGLDLEKRDQKPLPVLGREQRAESNWWLVSQLD